MTTGWLLLLMVVVSSQSVDGQPTTDDEVCDGQIPSRGILDNQQRLLQQLQIIKNRLGKLFYTLNLNMFFSIAYNYNIFVLHFVLVSVILCCHLSGLRLYKPCGLL